MVSGKPDISTRCALEKSVRIPDEGMTVTRLLTTTIAAITPLALAVVIPTSASAQDLASFGVLAGSTVTNTGPSVINGNVGVWPGLAVVGFPPGIVNAPFTIHPGDAVAQQAQSELTTAYNDLAGRPATANLTGQDLGGLVLTPGVYAFDDSAQLTGTLTLDGQGNPNALFIVNIGSTLTTGSASAVALVNGAQGGNVFFRVGSSATLGTDTAFAGKILALTSITLNTDADITCGSALARNGAVTLDTNTISVCAVLAATFGSVLDSSASDNQRAVADALDDFVAGGGILPPGFQNLIDFLSPAELADAFTQLSGEVATGVAPAGTQAMDSFLTLVLRPGFGDDRNGPGMVTAPGQGTVRVLGYGPEGPPAAARAFTSFDQTPPGSAPDSRLWEIWAAGYGAHNDTDGDASAGTHDRSSRNFGFAMGLDYFVTPNTKVGFALGGGGTDFGLSDSLGDGRSDMFQAAVYSRTNFDAIYVAAALAYAWHDVSTDRFVTLAGLDHFSAEFSAHNVAGQLEGGYRFGWLTPYAALRGQAFYTPAYSEDTESGASTFALAYDDRTTVTARTELGARIDHKFALDDGATLALGIGAAWAHDYWSDTSADASLQALAGSGFTVEGAEPESDSLLFSAGAQIGFKNGIAIAGSFDSEFAENSETYAGTGRVSYRW